MELVNKLAYSNFSFILQKIEPYFLFCQKVTKSISEIKLTLDFKKAKFYSSNSNFAILALPKNGNTVILREAKDLIITHQRFYIQINQDSE